MPLPKTESPGRLLTDLASRGIRMTGQRRIIVGIIETADRHLDAAQILRKAQKIDPGINRCDRLSDTLTPEATRISG